jgi:ABC-type glycerol-3-phosphate transport system permease component
VVTEGKWETIQIGLKSLSAATVDQSNIGLAAALIAAIPVLLLLIFLQKWNANTCNREDNNSGQGKQANTTQKPNQ